MTSDDRINKSGWDICSRGEADHLTHYCRSLVKSGPISMKWIRGTLSQTSFGKKNLNKFSMQKIQWRIKYERRKLQLNVWRKNIVMLKSYLVNKFRVKNLWSKCITKWGRYHGHVPAALGIYFFIINVVFQCFTNLILCCFFRQYQTKFTAAKT